MAKGTFSSEYKSLSNKAGLPALQNKLKNAPSFMGNKYFKPSKMPAFKKGGKVKKTGPAMVHKGEVVLNKAQQAKMKRSKLSKAADKMFGR